MKLRTLICLSVATMISTSAQAWVGGPFSNNSFDNTGSFNGTYQAVLRGKNVVGVMIFGTTNTTEFRDTGMSETTQTGSNSFVTTQLYDLTGNEGRFAMFVNGTVVAGTATASVDGKGRSITAVMEGSRNRGTQTITQNITTTGSSGTVLTTGTRTFELKDVLYVAGNFDAKISRTFPVQSFQGRGDLEVNDPTGVEEIEYDFTSTDLGNGVEQTTTTSKVVPKIDKSKVRLSVYGVKTSDEQPFFGSALRVEFPSVTEQ